MEMDKINKLKQEIEEYLTKDYCCEFKKECKDGVRVRCSAYEAKLYLILRFAEPREKRIEELEKTIANLKEQVQSQVEATIELDKEKAELEKKNAELKEANQTLATMNNDMWVELEKKRAESQGITNRLHQLIKAKEIIEVLNEGLDKLYLSGLSAKQIAFVEQLQDKAEQFLRGIEK